MPTSSEHESQEDSAVRRWWRVFLLVECALLLAWVVGAWVTFTSPISQLLVTFWSVLGSWLCFSLPVAVLYLLGCPLMMSLSFGPSPQERAYQRKVGARPALTGEEFYARFYEGSGIPPDIPARVRDCLAYLDILIERAYPSDVIGHAYDDLDWYDVVFRIEKAFRFQFTEEDYALFTGTLGNLIDLVHVRLRERD